MHAGRGIDQHARGGRQRASRAGGASRHGGLGEQLRSGLARQQRRRHRDLGRIEGEGGLARPDEPPRGLVDQHAEVDVGVRRAPVLHDALPAVPVLGDPQVVGDLGERLLVQPSELHSPLAELRRIRTWHTDILPRDTSRRLTVSVRQAGGSSRGRERTICEQSQVRDRCIDDTRLRAAPGRTGGPPPERELGQKICLDPPSPLAVAHTTVHPDPAESAPRARLPAAAPSKARRNLTTAGRLMAVDGLHGQLRGLLLGEIEPPIPSPAELVTALDAVAEVTDDARFTRGHLAATSSEQLGQLLAEHPGGSRH